MVEGADCTATAASLIKPHILSSTSNITAHTFLIKLQATMVRNTSVGASASDITSINLNRIVSRLQENLVNPDADTEERLRMNRYERQKVGAVSTTSARIRRKLELTIVSRISNMPAPYSHKLSKMR